VVRPPPYIPELRGLAALQELARVPWATLHHAYGRGVTGRGIHDDVARSLRELAHDPDEAIVGGLYSNICHQGTVYEATAYAVPFIAAVAVGADALRADLTHLLGSIAIAASFATADGCRAGAFGDGVDVLIRDALAACVAHCDAIAAAEPALAGILRAIRAVVATPSAETRAALRAVMGDEDEEDSDDADDDEES
jgi:hypothetical protein